MIVIEQTGAERYAATYESTMARIEQIPSARRTVPGVCGVWSVNDILGHLAFWDGILVLQLRAKAAARPFEQDVSDWETINDEQAAIRAEWSYAQLVAEANSNRVALLPLLDNPAKTRSNPKFSNIGRSIGPRLRSGWQMVEHESPAINAMIEKIDRSWSDLIGTIDRVDRRKRELAGVCGEYSVKDMMAHIAFWEGVIPEHIQRSAMGLNDTGRNIDKINNAVYLANKDRAVELVHVEMFRAHQVARDAVLGLKTKPKKALLDRIACETWDHYPEHTEQIAAWLKNSG